MSVLAKLQAAKSRDDLASLLGFKRSRLNYILYVLSDASKYSEFDIPKRGGGTRKIKAPDPRLKLLQRRLANLLYASLEDIDKAGSPRRPLAHGFARSLSIITNASAHRRRRYVLNFDLKDFFPSINFGRVRGMLMKDNRFGLDEKVATAIAQIACHANELPQGSPCSPVLSNIVAHLLDIRLVRFARQHKCTYSRYVDDITFSTNRSDFPTDVATPIGAVIGQWQLSNALITEIKKAGFEVNDKKTRMQIRGSRQLTTGLLVNEKVNVRPEYYRTVRSMCAALFSTGSYYQIIPAALVGGNAGDPHIKRIATTLAPLEGMLGYIYHVRNSVDRRMNVLKKKEATATRVLYHRFLSYKNFIGLEKPLIIPEGKTDSIYLKASIEKLTAFQPKLGAMVSGKLKLAVQFMNFTSTVHDVLQLGGGVDDLKFFLLRYQTLLNEFKHRPLKHPVILLIDNDDGASKIFPVASQLGVAGMSHSSTSSFYRFAGNLYLVKTPETGKTRIEDLFDPALFNTILNGKIFDPDKKHNAPGKYGKAVFAEKVIKPQIATINFSKFAPLLDRLVAVLDDSAINPAS